MHRGIIGALLGCFLWMSWVHAGDAEWYKVPAGGQVTFTLSQESNIYKGPPPSSIVFGDAVVTLEYLDGRTVQIVFQNSAAAVWSLVIQNTSGAYTGSTTWTQTASLAPGSVFQILSATPAQQWDPQLEFQGGQFGAYVKGFVSKFSADGLSVTPPSGPSSNLTPPSSASGGAPSNIHAVIVSGLSDPAKVIVSANVILTGGIVALGKNGLAPSTPSAWSPGLKIIPDYALLTGEKVPPVTPNIIDVRIVRQDVTADFPSPIPNPDN
jgi:hypothetical protein